MTEDHTHIEMEKSIANHCTEIGLHREQIKDLFSYRDQLQRSMGKIEIAFEALRKDQHSWAGTFSSTLSRIEDKLLEHYKNVESSVKKINGLEAKNEAFKWFTEPMNKMQKRLPWFILAVVLLILASFSVSWELLRKLLEVIAKLWR